MDDYLQVKNISCQRGVRKLFANVNFCLTKGQCLQIVGPNGCGKTSLLQIITGIRQADQGEIIWQGKLLADNRIHYHQSMHYLSHDLGIKNNLTVTENLKFDVRFQVKSKQQIAAAIQALGLSVFSQHMGVQLSQGQKQKVALAKLLCTGRKLWILDEPFSALDTGSMDTMQQLLQQHLKQQGSVILTTHRPLTLSSLTFDTLLLA